MTIYNSIIVPFEFLKHETFTDLIQFAFDIFHHSAHLIDLHERFYFKRYCNLNIFFFFFTYVNSRQDQFNEELIIMNEFVNNSSNFICEYKSISGTTIVCIQSDLIANGIRNGTCAGNACTTFGSIPRFNLDLA